MSPTGNPVLALASGSVRLLWETKNSSVLIKLWPFIWLNTEGFEKGVRGHEGDHDIIRVYLVPAYVMNVNPPTSREDFPFRDMLEHIVDTKHSSTAPAIRMSRVEVYGNIALFIRGFSF